MSDKLLKAAIIGTGMIANAGHIPAWKNHSGTYNCSLGTGMIANAGHIPAWKNLPEEVEIVAVADVLEERAQLVAETENIPYAYGDWGKMLAEMKPDIVSGTGSTITV